MNIVANLRPLAQYIFFHAKAAKGNTGVPDHPEVLAAHCIRIQKMLRWNPQNREKNAQTSWPQPFTS